MTATMSAGSLGPATPFPPSPRPRGHAPALGPGRDEQVSRGPDLEWSAPFGVVLPVLAGSAGAGASVFAAAAVDVLQRAGRCALLVDTAEPSRSGLSSATEVDGEHATAPAAGVRVRYSWRGHAVLARREPDPELGPGRHLSPTGGVVESYDDGPAALPGLEPTRWLPLPPLEPLHATVVDLGQDWSRPHTGGGSVLTEGAWAWLRAARGELAPSPVLVVRATRPSLAAAEAALARLDAHIGAGQLLAPTRLVVMASWKKRGWPKGVVGAAGARLARLVDDAVFVPYDRDLDIGGVTAEPTPARVQAAIAELLDDWGLLARPHR